MANFWMSRWKRLVLYVEAMLAKDKIIVQDSYIPFAIHHNRDRLQKEGVDYDRQELIEGAYLHCRYLYYFDRGEGTKADSAARRYNRWLKSMTN